MNDTEKCRRAAIIAGETVERLQREGYSSEDAQKMVLDIIRSEAQAMTRGNHMFDEAHCIERLRQLPGAE